MKQTNSDSDCTVCEDWCIDSTVYLVPIHCYIVSIVQTNFDSECTLCVKIGVLIVQYSLYLSIFCIHTLIHRMDGTNKL